MIQCKKKNNTSPIQPSICQENRHFEGKYVGTDTWQHDTIEIIFNKMSPDCRRMMTIKRFSKVYNLTVSNCNMITNQDYDIVDNKIIITNSPIQDNVWSSNGIVNDNDITIYGCNNQPINFKKI